MSGERGTRNAEPEGRRDVSPRTLVCFALKEEAGAFRKLTGNSPDIQILLTGIGRQNAQQTLQEFLHRQTPTQVFTCGFAGALDPELRIGDVVFLTVDWRLDQVLVRAGARAASFYCVSRMLTTAREKVELREKTRASAVEMESAVIHELCVERGIHCTTVRAISDGANEDLPLDFNQLSNPDQSLNLGKIAWAVGKSPWKIPGLIRLGRNSQFAARRLAAVLQQVIDQKLPPVER